MSFDPNVPATNAEATSAMFRTQFQGLKALIDAIPGLTGFEIDSVTTLPPGTPAFATSVVVGTVVHVSLGLPEGQPGAQGPEGQTGPPGEVTFAAMNAADEAILQQTSNNTNNVGTLGMVADSSYQQWQMQALIDKVDEHINAGRRSGGGP